MMMMMKTCLAETADLAEAAAAVADLDPFDNSAAVVADWTKQRGQSHYYY